MITNVSFMNYKSLQHVKNLELKPLTLITGQNSSGKSNILEAISFFGQASRKLALNNMTQIDYETVFLQGDRKYPKPIEDYIVYKNDVSLLVSLSLNFSINKEESNNLKNLINELNLDPQDNPVFKEKIFTIGFTYEFIINRSYYIQKLLLNNKTIFEVKDTEKKQRQVTYPQDTDTSVVGFARNIFNPQVFVAQRGDKYYVDTLNALSPIIFDILKRRTYGIYYLSGERGKIQSEIYVQQDRRREESPITWVGHYSEYTLEILSDCFKNYTSKFNKIVEWSKKFHLHNIRAGLDRNYILASNFTDKIINVDLNTHLAGLGSRQILPIITQIFYSEPNDVILIEEPEISLHPNDQVLLHELFAEAVKEGKQIICTTHSPFLVLALSKIIKKGILDVDDIAVYHIRKTKEGTQVELMTLNEKGFIEGGIPSFMKVELDLFKEWSESLENEE